MNEQFPMPEVYSMTMIENKIREISDIADQVPGVIIIHRLPEFSLQYMSPLGLKLLGKEWNEVKGMTGQEYHERFFNAEEAKNYVPKILDILQRNTDETVSYFQQVRTSKSGEWDWYMSMTKILLRDSENRPLLSITTAMQIDPQHYFTSKAVRLLEENVFLRKHYHEFGKLTKREKEILKLLALGKSAIEIGDKLNISAATAETHRKNIKQKLKAGNSYELSQYARAFDLI
jgi:DNA-binding CsgD family transcriptional regulator